MATVIMTGSVAFLNVYFSWGKKCAENTAGEILCNRALQAAIKQRSSLPHLCGKEIKLKYIQHLILCQELAKSFLCIMTLNSHSLSKWPLSLLPPLSRAGDELREVPGWPRSHSPQERNSFEPALKTSPYLKSIFGKQK